MTKEYKSLEHSIRMIMEGNHLEEAGGIGGGISGTKFSKGAEGTINLADFVPIVGTARSAKDAYNAFASGDIMGGIISTGLTALSGLGDIAMLSGVGAPAGAALKGLAGTGKVAKAVDVASDVAKAADAASDVAKAGGAAAKAADAASDVAKAADAASDAALIRRVTSGKNKGKGADTPQAEVQGNLALKPKPLEVKPTKTDNKIEVPAAANQPGAPGTNVVGLPQSGTRITPANPNTRVATPGQAPANLNVPTVRPTVPTTNVRTPAAANQPVAPSRAAETPGQPTTVTRTADDAAPAPTTRRVAEPEAAPAPSVKTEPEAAPAPSTRTNPEPNAKNKPKDEEPPPRSRRRKRRDLDLFLAGFRPAMDNQSAAGQASGVGTFMHKAGAPLKVSEENEADKARTSIENVARLNSRRDKAVKQQEIQKKILDEKRSLADTVKRNVEETRAKQKMESPIITNPELKRPEPEGVNNVR